MPGRKIVLANGQFYHIVNRGINSQLVFLKRRDYKRALNIFFYYQNQSLPMRYSYFIERPANERQEIFRGFRAKKDFLAEIIAYCLMPNHFHFLLRQKVDNGISKFLSNFANSYTRYFNTKEKRTGPLFQGKFKAVRIETEAQLLHISRYIHLNPYASYVVKHLGDLVNYPYSSFSEYLGVKESGLDFCDKGDILYRFKTRNKYKEFVFDQADYQRHLEKIKRLVLED